MHTIMLYDPPAGGPTPIRTGKNTKMMNRGKGLKRDPDLFSFVLRGADDVPKRSSTHNQTQPRQQRRRGLLHYRRSRRISPVNIAPVRPASPMNRNPSTSSPSPQSSRD